VIPSQGGFRINTRPSNQGAPVTIQDTAARYAPYVLSIVRIVAALLFFEHGTSRLFGWPSPLPAPAPLSMYWFAGAIELVGGALLALGLFTRPAALIMSGEMAFAYFISHASAGFFRSSTAATPPFFIASSFSTSRSPAAARGVSMR
jgi:putative oxidoreductase